MDLEIRNLEIKFLKLLRNNSNNFWDSLFQIITYLGESSVLIAVLLLIYFIIDKKLGEKLMYIVFNSLFINNIVKGLIKYPRPFTYNSSLDALKIDSATGFSFPSGHTQIATTLYFGIAKESKFTKKYNMNYYLLWIIATILTILVGFSRLLLAVHYPKDVIFGIIFGLISVYLFSYIYKRYGRCNKHLLNIISLLVAFPFLFIFYKKSYNEFVLYKDFYVVYALFLGFTLGSIIENKYVNFSCNTSLKKRFLRLFLGLIVLLFCIPGLKIVFPKNNMIFVFIRYFLSTFLTIGILPLILKKSVFKD